MRGKEIDPFEHPAQRERPCDIAGLFVLKTEWPDLNAICAAHGGAKIIEVKTVPIIPAVLVDVLCADSATAVALTMGARLRVGEPPSTPQRRRGTGLGPAVQPGPRYPE